MVRFGKTHISKSRYGAPGLLVVQSSLELRVMSEIAGLAEGFLAMLANERGASEHTVRAYARDGRADERPMGPYSANVTVSGDIEENRLAVRGASLLPSGTTVVTYGP